MFVFGGPRLLCSVLLGSGVVLAGGLSPGSHARAQPPSPQGPVPGASLEEVAGPGARLHRGPGGALALAHGLALSASGRTAAERARHVLARFARDFGVDGMDLRVSGERSVHGRTVVRLQRHAFGLPVHGRVAVVRLDGRGRVDLVRANLGARAEDDHGPAVQPRALEARALAKLPRWPGRRVVHVRPLAVDTGPVVVRAWAFEIEGRSAARRALLLFDARDGSFLGGEHLVHEVLGRVYESNPAVSMGETVERELLHLASAERLNGEYVRVASCEARGGGCDPIHHALADDEGNFLFEPEEPAYDDAFAEVNAYHHVDRISAYFRDQHEFVWRCCGGDTALDVMTNFVEAPGEPYNNASYAGNSCARDFCGAILLGQGRARDYAYDGDVIYHEFMHAVVEQVADLVGFHLDPAFGMGYDSGALNEGTADYFAASLSGDPNMSEYFADVSGPAGAEVSLRQLDNGLRCPHDLFGEIHQDGRIWGGVAWSIREALGAEQADALLFATLATLESSSSFADAGELLVANAMAMADDGLVDPEAVALVEEAVDARGLRDCERIVPLEDGELRLGYSGDALRTGGLGGSVAPLHYRIDVPADATALVLRVEPLTRAGEYTVHVRAGAPARFRVGRLPPLQSDAAFEESSEVRLDEASGPPLPRCDTLYVALQVEDLNRRGPSVYGIEATLERSGVPDAECPQPEPEPEPEPDAGAMPVDAGTAPRDGGAQASTDAGSGTDAASLPGDRSGFTPGGGGCDCRVGPSRPRSAPDLALLALLALGLGLIRRRR